MARTLALAILFCTAAQLRAQETVWTGAADSNFLNPANWSAGSPGSFEALAVIEGGNNLPVTIPADAGSINVGAIQIGVDELAGSLVQNGGTLVISGDDLDAESFVGLAAMEPTRWVLNNNATVLYDGPLDGAGDGLDTDGTGKDFDVGNSVPEGAEGTLELHDNAVFRISDDLKVADGDAGHGVVIMDGNALMTIGSGISSSGVSRFEIAGNATLVTGNSSDPGDAQNGRTNEGYFTLSTGDGEESTVVVRENGKVYARTLQQRGGVSSIDLQDNAQFHIFDVFENSEPSVGNATVTGSAQGPQRTSHVASSPTAEMNIRLSGTSTMTVDSDLDDSGWSGLAISGGNNSGGNTEGGLTTIEIRDEATLIVQQDLHLTLGIGEFAESVLTIVGPDATVGIGGDLRLALDDFDDENPGSATLEAVISGPSHSTMTVGGTALIANGNLSVRFDGYTPAGGEVYELLTAGSISAGEFQNTVLPALPDGLSWSLEIGANSVVLSVSGGTLGDFDSNGVLDANDIDLLTAQVGSNEARYDLDNDGAVTSADREVWVNDVKRTYMGDSNLDGEFNSGDLVAVFSLGEYEDGIDGNSTWAAGDWDGSGDFDSSDIVTAFAAGGYEQGPRAASAAAVPEPTSGGWLVILAGCSFMRRRAGKCE